MNFSKKIVDIEINAESIRVERKFELTSRCIEKKLLRISYSGKDLIIDREVEEALLPPFIASFYYFVFSKLTIPTCDEFKDIYFKINPLDFADNYIFHDKKRLPIKGVEGRLLRAYPSLIRDLHFYLLLRESDLFENVSYSLKRDYYDGLDLQVLYKEKEYFLSLYIKTKRGDIFKLKKDSRHKYSDIEELIMAVPFSELKKHGDIYLLSEKQIRELLSELNRITS